MGRKKKKVRVESVTGRKESKQLRGLDFIWSQRWHNGSGVMRNTSRILKFMTPKLVLFQVMTRPRPLLGESIMEAE